MAAERAISLSVLLALIFPLSLSIGHLLSVTLRNLAYYNQLGQERSSLSQARRYAAQSLLW